MYRFANFELSVDDQELRKNGLLIRLPPQPLQVLAMLLEKPGDVITREEFRARLWGETQTNVEFDAGVNRCIRQIRAVLNDDSDAPRYIETIPRRGYRFIAAVENLTPQRVPVEVKQLVPAVLAPEPPEPVVVASLQPSSRRYLPYVIVVAVLTTAAVGYWIWNPSGKRRATDLAAVPLAVTAGDHYSPTFSPDGRQIAFTWNGENRNNYDIYVRDVSSQAPPLRLTNDLAMDYSPAWSPDGNWIAFVRGTSGQQGAIILVHPLGGQERKLHVTRSFPVASRRDMSWTPDSKYLIVANDLGHDNKSEICSIEIVTGEVKTLLSAEENEHYISPAVSPDGKTVAFTRDFGPGIAATMLYSRESGGTARVLPSQAAALNDFKGVLNRYPAWTPDGKNLVFTSDSGGGNHLWLAPFEGEGPMERLTSLGDTLGAAFISKQGQMAFVREEYDTNIWRLDLNRAVSDPKPNPVQVISSTRIENNPAVSPDGKRLAFASNQSGSLEIWVSDISGQNAEPVTSMGASVTGSPAWSPDGMHIAFDSRAEGKPAIYVVDSNGGKASRLTPTDTSGVVPHWSPDGQWIYYSSEMTGRMEIWRITLSGQHPEKVTTLGGFAGILSPDGKYLYYGSNNAAASGLWEMSLATGSPRFVADTVLNRAFGKIPSGLLYIQGEPDTDQHTLFGFDLQTRRPKMLLHLQHQIDRGVSVSPDGTSLYYTGVDRAAHELLLVPQFWN